MGQIEQITFLRELAADFESYAYPMDFDGPTSIYCNVPKKMSYLSTQQVKTALAGGAEKINLVYRIALLIEKGHLDPDLVYIMLFDLINTNYCKLIEDLMRWCGTGIELMANYDAYALARKAKTIAGLLKILYSVHEKYCANEAAYRSSLDALQKKIDSFCQDIEKFDSASAKYEGNRIDIEPEGDYSNLNSKAVDNAQLINLTKVHLEDGIDECRWCFAVDMERVKGKEVARHDFPDGTLLHYFCPRCRGEFSNYTNGWGEDYVKEKINKLHPELKGEISDEFFGEVNNRVLFPDNLDDYIDCDEMEVSTPTSRNDLGIKWVKLVADQIVVKTSYGIFTYDNNNRQLRPLLSKKYGDIIDFDKIGNNGIAFCHQGEQLNLIEFKSGTQKVEMLPAEISFANNIRVILDNDILLLFANGGAFLRTGENWHPFQKLSTDTKFLPAPEHFLRTDKIIYLAYGFNEWGSACLIELDKGSYTWKSQYPNVIDTGVCLDKKWKSAHQVDYCADLCPVQGIIETPDGHIWFSRGLFHLGASWGSLYKYDGEICTRVIPGEFVIPRESMISGIGCMPTGEIRIVVPDLGLFELNIDQIKFILPNIRLGIKNSYDKFYIGRLTIDKEGRNFITHLTYNDDNTTSEGLILVQKENDELMVQTLPFDFDAPPVYLEEILKPELL